ncbi:hypothetical protein A1O1_01805, partial [Capronia coronata CBS 617.96]
LSCKSVMEAVGGEVSAERRTPNPPPANESFRGRVLTSRSLAIAGLTLLFRVTGCAGHSDHQSI